MTADWNYKLLKQCLTDSINHFTILCSTNQHMLWALPDFCFPEQLGKPNRFTLFFFRLKIFPWLILEKFFAWLKSISDQWIDDICLLILFTSQLGAFIICLSLTGRQRDWIGTTKHRYRKHLQQKQTIGKLKQINSIQNRKLYWKWWNISCR